MENDEITVRDILAKEGLGSFAFELESLHSDLESASVPRLLATVIGETQRLQDWPHQPPELAHTARECQRLAIEVTEGLSASEEIKYRRLLIAGYLYGRLTLPSREVFKRCHEFEMRKMRGESGLRSRDELTKNFRAWIQREASREWENDTEEKLRISDVCNIIHPKVLRAKEKLINRNVRSAKKLPSSKEKIREYIKEDAPKYASRPGAPRTPSSK
ncbi:hypothetical protein [Halomonas sp. 3H]|uniref:hypothetical protein n=1 Tax=Halomonas sp. 3H TaxID=2952527 RepID=UPI0020B705BF|nr:hypothetical protein [Halomonas sp. 3H]